MEKEDICFERLINLFNQISSLNHKSNLHFVFRFPAIVVQNLYKKLMYSTF